MSEPDESTAGREMGADEGERGMRPFSVFSLLVGILALILSIGFAVATGLTRPVGYALVSSARSTAAADAASSGGAPCSGPGCAGVMGTVGPFAGGGSMIGQPTSPTYPTGAPGTVPGGVAPDPAAPAPPPRAVPTPLGAAAVPVTLDLAGGRQSVAAPPALAPSPLLAEVVEAYLRCWRERARSYALADPALLPGVLVEPALGEATGRFERLRLEGRVQWFEDGHAITLLAIEGEWAWLVDEYTVGIGAAPSPRPSATSRQTPARPFAATVAPPLRERVRATFTLKRVDGVWKIADSASVPVR